MHAWEGKPFQEVDLLTQRRDPRRFTIGCATCPSNNPDEICLQWFRNIPEISQWLRRMEPQRWGLRGAGLIELKAQLEPILTQVDVYGITSDLIPSHNQITRAHYQLLWWGEFSDLAAGTDSWTSRFLKTEGLQPIASTNSEQARSMALALRQRIAEPE